MKNSDVPIRSPNFSNIRGPVLTDRKILSYILAGRYGEARRIAALAAQKPRGKKRKTKAEPSVLHALDLLRKLSSK